MKNNKVDVNAENIFSDPQKLSFYNARNPFEVTTPSKISDFNFFDETKPLDGSKLNNSDRELIQSHLEKYLPSDSLRLEIQIQRVSKELDASKNELKCLELLEKSKSVTVQQKAIKEKMELLSSQLNEYKEQYKKISSIHNIAITLQDGIKSNADVATRIKKSIYGKKAKYVETFKNSKDSIKLLSSKLENIQELPDKPETESTIIDIINSYNKIVINANKAEKEYINSMPKDLFSILKSNFQKLYYGYEIPDKY